MQPFNARQLQLSQKAKVTKLESPFSAENALHNLSLKKIKRGTP